MLSLYCQTLYFVYICSVEDLFTLASNKFRMVYKIDGNPQLDSRDWSMYLNILNGKCYPNKPLVDGDTIYDLTIEPSTKGYVTVAVYNRSNTAQILPSGLMGGIHVSDSDNDTKFQAAATDTAEQIADNVIAFLSSQAAFYKKASSHSPESSTVKLKLRLRSIFPDDANKEMNKALGKQSLNTFVEHKFITGLIDDEP